MGRNFALIIFIAVLSGCLAPPNESQAFAECANSEVILLPHHALVEPVIRDMYEALAKNSPRKVVIVSPDHFFLGEKDISIPTEREHGFTLHRDWAKEYFPDATVEGYTIKVGAEGLLEFAKRLSQEDALFIFSIDFSHYLPGQIAYVHDQKSMDVIESRSISEAQNLEVDSPESVEVLLRLLELRDQKMNILRNTNPSLDAGIDTFENTTHLFGCSSPGIAPARQVMTTMLFARPRDWYLGKTEEDRYLYGTDKVLYNQGGLDTAVLEYEDGRTETFTFDYFQ